MCFGSKQAWHLPDAIHRLEPQRRINLQRALGRCIRLCLDHRSYANTSAARQWCTDSLTYPIWYGDKLQDFSLRCEGRNLRYHHCEIPHQPERFHSLEPGRRIRMQGHVGRYICLRCGVVIIDSANRLLCRPLVAYHYMCFPVDVINNAFTQINTNIALT